MAMQKEERRLRIKKRIRKKISGTETRPRLSVFRSNTAIYAQIIDDTKGNTLAAASSKEIAAGNKSVNIELAKQVGQLIAKKAAEKGVSSVTFDRNGYLYHGRVKSFADGAREGGLQF
jgi:large subunit ribosomal protein L18